MTPTTVYSCQTMPLQGAPERGANPDRTETLPRAPKACTIFGGHLLQLSSQGAKNRRNNT